MIREEGEKICIINAFFITLQPRQSATCILHLANSTTDHYPRNKLIKNTSMTSLRYLILSTLVCLQSVFALAQNTPVGNEPDIITEHEAMDFLYRYMPTPDAQDHDRAYFLAQVQTALRARSEMPWGKVVPKREFMHFVLPVRVNNEDLDDFRTMMYDELKQRVQGMTIGQAALEVNHWCHEHVTYQPSDMRTSSPLSSMRSAIGRCGEESTFTVAALRTVGIPARQVYTPRWAHTDDNHAWVEAWIDGEWKFMGACEPEPVLNLGWFNAPASRAMIMHTKAFGHYDGPERVMNETPCYTEIDVTDTYAPTSVFKVQVVDGKGRPVKATVQFRLYNYAEFYPLCTRQTDNHGQTDFKAGHGDLLVWATDGTSFGFEKVHVGDKSSIRIKLTYTPDKMNGKKVQLDVTPPIERNTIPLMSDEQIAENKHRLATEDKLRAEYTNTFYKGKDELIRKARGNHQVIKAFLDEAEDKEKARMLLSLLAEKDLRDVPLNVLRDHYQYTTQPLPNILNPRISNELLTPYRSQLLSLIPEVDQQRFRYNPALMAQWCEQHITLDNEHNPQQLCMHPATAYKTRRCDSHSRDILFVAMARTLGIEARIDEVTGKVQWRGRDGKIMSDEEASWNTVFEPKATASAARQGKLQLTYTPDSLLTDPSYNTHFTISKIEHGVPVLLNYPECQPFSTIFSNPVMLDEGSYILTTGTRLAKGGVLSEMTFFSIKAGQLTTLPLTLRASTDEIQVIGHFSSETRYTPITNKNFIASTLSLSGTGIKVDVITKETSLLSTTGRGYYVIGLLSEGTEPTNHVLNDLSAVREQLEQWGRPILLICKNAEELGKIIKAFPNLPSTVHFGIDSTGQIAEGMKTAVQGEPGTQQPHFLIADTFDRVVFSRQGYTINLGDQILKVCKKL